DVLLLALDAVEAAAGQFAEEVHPVLGLAGTTVLLDVRVAQSGRRQVAYQALEPAPLLWRRELKVAWPEHDNSADRCLTSTPVYSSLAVARCAVFVRRRCARQRYG